MVEEQITGKVVDIDADGTLTIKAGVPSIDRALLRQYKDCLIVLDDGRHISPVQRRKIYALIGEIDEYVNGIRTEAGMGEQKAILKMEFMLKRMTDAERRVFSLSNCSVTVATNFIGFLIDFILSNDIPTRFPLYEQADDIERYVYACLANKKCAVCGRPCDLHHAEGSRIGMGSDREKVHHLGREALPLCRKHHDECHGMPEREFLEKYHLVPVKLDDKLCKVYGLRR